MEGNIYNRNDFFLQRFISSRKKFSIHLFDSLALQSMPGRIIEIFAVLGLFILIVSAKWAGNADSSMLITIGAFMAAAYKIIPGIVKIINLSGQMKANEFSADEPEQNKQAEKKSSQAAAAGIESVELKNIYFRYESAPVLHNFSATFPRGVCWHNRRVGPGQNNPVQPVARFFNSCRRRDIDQRQQNQIQ